MSTPSTTQWGENIPTKKRFLLLLLSAILLAIGNCGGPIVSRLYFIHGGKRVWLSSGLETGGWPIMIIPLLITYLNRRKKEGSKAKLFSMGGRMFVAAIVIGVLTALDDYLYAYGLACQLPIKISVLVNASQLAFTALFAFLLVKQKFTPYSINAVVLLTAGAGILALQPSGDNSNRESKNKKYYIGIFTTMAAAILYGFVLPLVELTYDNAKQAITYTLVLEIELVICLFATLVCTIGMTINKDFKAIPREARDFGLGQTTYYVVLVCIVIIWQAFFLGAIGVIYAGSSFLSAIIIAVLLPMTKILAIIFYNEKFTVEKGVSLLLSLWGFVSYFYGELRHTQKNRETQALATEMQQNISSIQLCRVAAKNLDTALAPVQKQQRYYSRQASITMTFVGESSYTV